MSRHGAEGISEFHDKIDASPPQNLTNDLNIETPLAFKGLCDEELVKLSADLQQPFDASLENSDPIMP